MKIGYLMPAQPGALDEMLFTLARALAARGWRTCGLVQINTQRTPCHPCDMDVQVLPDGPVLRISQTLGRASRGCRLDPGALEAAVAQVDRRLTPQTDVLIVNKFGKHEADGRGFREVIAKAIEQDIAVIVGVNTLNLAAFLNFTGGLAEQIAPGLDAMVGWLQSANAGESETI